MPPKLTSPPRKEACIIIVDVGASMSGARDDGRISGLDLAKKSIQLMIQQKLLFPKQDGHTDRQRKQPSNIGVKNIATAGITFVDLVRVAHMRALSGALFSVCLELGILLVGSSETDNVLNMEDPDSYHHITTFKQLQKPDLNMLEAIK